MLERVSEEVGLSWLTSHTNFSDDGLINWVIKNGDWRQLINDNSVTSNVIVEIESVTYVLDSAVADRLETYFTTYIGSNCKTRYVICVSNQHIFTEMMRTDKDKALPSVCASLNDLKLRV